MGVRDSGCFDLGLIAWGFRILGSLRPHENGDLVLRMRRAASGVCASTVGSQASWLFT